MAAIVVRDLSYGHGGPPLVAGATLRVSPNDRICIVGRNGCGKSTFLSVLSRETKPDAGVVDYASGVRVASLSQHVPAAREGTVRDVVAEGLGEAGEAIRQYQAAADLLGSPDADADAAMRKLERAQATIERLDAWDLRAQVETVIERLHLEPDAEFSSLSGGMKRRALLGRALVEAPDVLLLDEPTNHLDMDSVAWLEATLATFQGAVLFVTHDRAFLRAVATRIVEIERGRMSVWDCNYDLFLERRDEARAADDKARALFDKKLADEEVWIRQGIKARRTRNEGRVRALKKLREAHKKRRVDPGKARIQVAEAQKTGRLVVETKDMGFVWPDGKRIVQDLSTAIMRGDRLGIVGPNGCGKTTLIRLLLDNLDPTEGTIARGTNLEVAYFDQLRSVIRDDLSVADNVADGNDRVSVNGQDRHVLGYLKDFLFLPDRARGPASVLSGGERNRLLLAKLFLRPSNVLLLDEPTNDLDIETLELLEEHVAAYTGTVVVVSHDRAFLDAVCTSVIAWESPGVFREYVGGWTDVERERARVAAASTAAAPATAAPKGTNRPRREATNAASEPADAGARALSYKERKELDALPKTIESLEAQVEALQQRLADPALYVAGSSEAAPIQAQLATTEGELEVAFERWTELEERA